jgi:hypothetical protein
MAGPTRKAFVAYALRDQRMQRPFSKESAGPMLFHNPMTIARGNLTLPSLSARSPLGSLPGSNGATSAVSDPVT